MTSSLYGKGRLVSRRRRNQPSLLVASVVIGSFGSMLTPIAIQHSSAASIKPVRSLVAGNKLASLLNSAPASAVRVRAVTWYPTTAGTEIRWTPPSSPVASPAGYSWVGYRIHSTPTIKVDVLRTTDTSRQLTTRTFGSGFPKVELVYRSATGRITTRNPVTATRIDGPVRWVALGDSYAAGTGAEGAYRGPAGGQATYQGTDKGNRPCYKSTAALAPQVADRLGGSAFIALHHTACQGATTADVTAEQLQALRQDTDLVTLGIGGNDIGFGDVARSCVYHLFQSEACNLGSPPPARATVSQVENQIVALIRAVRDRSPKARILLTSYPHLLPPRERLREFADPVHGGLRVGACQVKIWFDPVTAGWLTGTLQPELNRAIDRAARRGGAVLVELASATSGHWLSETQISTGTSWINPISCRLDPQTGQQPITQSLHPNLAGQSAMADALSRHLNTRPVPAEALSPASSDFPRGSADAAAFTYSYINTSANPVRGQYRLFPALTSTGGLRLCMFKQDKNADGDWVAGPAVERTFERDGTISELTIPSANEPHRVCTAEAEDRDGYIYRKWSDPDRHLFGLEKFSPAGQSLWQLPGIDSLYPSFDGGHDAASVGGDRNKIATFDSALGATIRYMEDDGKPANSEPDGITKRGSVLAVNGGPLRLSFWANSNTGQRLRTSSGSGIASSASGPGSDMYFVHSEDSQGPCLWSISRQDEHGVLWSTPLPKGYCQGEIPPEVYPTGDGSSYVRLWGEGPMSIWRLDPSGRFEPTALAIIEDHPGGPLRSTVDRAGNIAWVQPGVPCRDYPEGRCGRDVMLRTEDGETRMIARLGDETHSVAVEVMFGVGQLFVVYAIFEQTEEAANSDEDRPWHWVVASYLTDSTGDYSLSRAYKP